MNSGTSMFEYLGVLISVILGLALTHLLRGLSKLIHMRHTVRPYWVHIVWTLNVIIYVLAIWWSMFWWNKLDTWTIEQFFFLTGYAIVLFMLASMLYPPEFGGDHDFETYFFDNRRWFFGIQFLAFVVDVPETLSKQSYHLRDTPASYGLLVPFILGICVVGALSANRRLHAALCLVWLVTITGYLESTALERIVG